MDEYLANCFQFLGIPPKGERLQRGEIALPTAAFPISRDPPEGGTPIESQTVHTHQCRFQFLGIPPKGELGKPLILHTRTIESDGFQFLGIPPKGERTQGAIGVLAPLVLGFQFLGIPPKGELHPY